jgi:hypothetical protein
MKIWVVESEIMTTYDEHAPQDFWKDIEKIFDSKEKAISYVQESIKDAIDEQRKNPDPDVERIIDHVPTEEELIENCGCWYKSDNEGIKQDYSYVISEYVVE